MGALRDHRTLHESAKMFTTNSFRFYSSLQAFFTCWDEGLSVCSVPFSVISLWSMYQCFWNQPFDVSLHRAVWRPEWWSIARILYFFFYFEDRKYHFSSARISLEWMDVREWRWNKGRQESKAESSLHVTGENDPDKTSEIKFSADRSFPVLWAQQSDLLTSSETLRITPRAKNIFGNMFGKENSRN